MPSSSLSSVLVCHSAINVGAMRLSLVRLWARSSIGAEVPHPPLGLVWCGCTTERLPRARVSWVLWGGY